MLIINTEYFFFNDFIGEKLWCFLLNFFKKYIKDLFIFFKNIKKFSKIFLFITIVILSSNRFNTNELEYKYL